MRIVKYLFIGAFLLLAAYHFYPTQTKQTLSTGYDKASRASHELAK